MSKLLTLLQGKLAVAVLGAVVVGGGGAAVAVVASQSHISGAQGAQQANGSHGNATETADAHSNVSVVGVLKAYDASGNTISVLADGASSATTIAVDANTKVNGEHAQALSDLTNAIGHGVQVEAKKQSDGSLLAWKVTVQANTGHGGATPGANREITGTVSQVGANSFVVTLSDGSTVTVTVSSATQFVGDIHGFSDLKANMSVDVRGDAQTDGSVAAIKITGHVGGAGNGGSNGSQPTPPVSN